MRIPTIKVVDNGIIKMVYSNENQQSPYLENKKLH